MSKIILFSSGCPKCKVLSAKMDKKNIEYEVSSDFDEIIEKGFKSAPILKVDDEYLEFSKANEWVNAQ